MFFIALFNCQRVPPDFPDTKTTAPRTVAPLVGSSLASDPGAPARLLRVPPGTAGTRRVVLGGGDDLSPLGMPKGMPKTS